MVEKGVFLAEKAMISEINLDVAKTPQLRIDNRRQSVVCGILSYFRAISYTFQYNI